MENLGRKPGDQPSSPRCLTHLLRYMGDHLLNLFRLPFSLLKMKAVEPDLSRSFPTRIKFDISNWRSGLQVVRKISSNGDCLPHPIALALACHPQEFGQDYGLLLPRHWAF